MAPVDGKVSLSLCQMLEGEKKAATAASWQPILAEIMLKMPLRKVNTLCQKSQ